MRALRQLAAGPLRPQCAQALLAHAQLGGAALGSGGAAAAAWGALRLLSSAEAGPNSNLPKKSMLDASLPHAGAAGSALSGAATQRLRSLAEAEPGAGAAAGATAADAGAAAAGPSVLRRALSWLFDASIIASLAAALAGGYTYYRYSIPEVEAALAEAQQLQAQPAGADAADGADYVQQPSQRRTQLLGAAGAAGAAGQLARLRSQLSAQVMQAYLAVAVPVDRKVREYTDPTCDALLPELAPELRGRVKTLVLDLEDLLVHKEWSRARGWQVMKRPGVEAFLLEMGRRYEVVIYTDENAMYADPVINKIDPHRAVTYRLYRQDTQYNGGKHVRDLSKLNRDLSQVLFVSANPAAYSFQPENALKLKPWNHSPSDTTLLDLIPLLQMVQEVHVNDVRDVVRSYDGEDDVAAAFKQRMAAIGAKKSGAAPGRFRLAHG